jgi:hypothetical protein
MTPAQLGQQGHCNKGINGQPDGASLTWALAPQQQGQQLQSKLGATGLALSAWLDPLHSIGSGAALVWLWRCSAYSALLGSGLLDSAQLGLFWLNSACSVWLSLLGSFG